MALNYSFQNNLSRHTQSMLRQEYLSLGVSKLLPNLVPRSGNCKSYASHIGSDVLWYTTKPEPQTQPERLSGRTAKPRAKQADRQVEWGGRRADRGKLQSEVSRSLSRSRIDLICSKQATTSSSSSLSNFIVHSWVPSGLFTGRRLKKYALPPAPRRPPLLLLRQLAHFVSTWLRWRGQKRKPKAGRAQWGQCANMCPYNTPFTKHLSFDYR